MRIKAEKFLAIYSAVHDSWEIETEDIIVEVKYFLVQGIDGVKCDLSLIHI